MRKLIVALPLLLALALAHAADTDKPAEKKEKHKEKPAAAAKVDVTKAICVLSPTEGNKAAGWVKFTKKDDGVLVEAEVSGLTPGQKHGFHIHEFGDISAPDGMATGGHFNPAGHDHAGPDDARRHAGDFGNIEADDKGVGKYSRLDKQIRLGGPKNNVIGRGIIVHASADDLTTQPTGNAGARIAQGVIGVAKSE